VKLHNLRDFVTVARCGGIRAAARELGLSQPSLTKSLRSLEQDLGVPLFERNKKGLTVNSFGSAFLVRAEAAMQELERGRDEILHLRGSSGGKVAMAASSVVALMFLTSALARFRRKFGSAEVSIQEGTYSNMLRGLRDGTLDFAIGPQPAANLADDILIEPLFANTRRVIGRLGHPLAKARSLGDLIGLHWVITGVVGPQDHEFYEIFRSYGIEPPEALIRCESLIALLSILAGSDAVAFLPRQWAESKLTEGLLQEIGVVEDIAGPKTCLIRRAAMPLTPAAEALADALRREVTYYVKKQGIESL
jgi:LysR family transcriptional regulator, regulator of abg operon